MDMALIPKEGVLKSMGAMLSFIHFMDVMESYMGSKGVRETMVEDGLWGILAPLWTLRRMVCTTFDLVLRIGKSLELRGGNVEAIEKRVGMLLRLRQTKVGRRRAANEFAVVEELLVQAALKLVPQDCAAGDLLIGCLPHHWQYQPGFNINKKLSNKQGIISTSTISCLCFGAFCLCCTVSLLLSSAVLLMLKPSVGYV